MSAFANTKGGRLVIGVSDDRKVLGLGPDYETLKGESARDGFELHLFQLLINAFGDFFCTQSVSVKFPTINDKEICVVRIRRTKSLLHVEKVDKSGHPLCQGCCPLLYFSLIFRWAG